MNESENTNTDGPVRVTITLEPVVHEMGKKLAKSQRRPFSNYLAWLIDQDAAREQASRPAVTEKKEGVAA